MVSWYLNARVVWILFLVLYGSLSSSLPTYGERRERGGHFIVVARKPEDILGTGQKNGDPLWLRSLGLEAQGITDSYPAETQMTKFPIVINPGGRVHLHHVRLIGLPGVGQSGHNQEAVGG